MDDRAGSEPRFAEGRYFDDRSTGCQTRSARRTTILPAAASPSRRRASRRSAPANAPAVERSITGKLEAPRQLVERSEIARRIGVRALYRIPGRLFTANPVRQRADRQAEPQPALHRRVGIVFVIDLALRRVHRDLVCLRRPAGCGPGRAVPTDRSRRDPSACCQTKLDVKPSSPLRTAIRPFTAKPPTSGAPSFGSGCSSAQPAIVTSTTAKKTMRRHPFENTFRNNGLAKRCI